MKIGLARPDLPSGDIPGWHGGFGAPVFPRLVRERMWSGVCVGVEGEDVCVGVEGEEGEHGYFHIGAQHMSGSCVYSMQSRSGTSGWRLHNIGKYANANSCFGF